MKKIVFTLLVCFSCLSLSSCYVHTYDVGSGAQGSTVVKKKNNFLFRGLINIGSSNPSEMAGDATNYTVTTKFSFVDYLLSGLTGGIYTPTTTTVTK